MRLREARRASLRPLRVLPHTLDEAASSGCVAMMILECLQSLFPLSYIAPDNACKADMPVTHPYIIMVFTGVLCLITLAAWTVTALALTGRFT